MATPIKFYFDFVSAYSYVAMNRIEALGANAGGGRWSGTVCRCRMMLAHHARRSRRAIQPAKFAHNM